MIYTVFSFVFIVFMGLTTDQSHQLHAQSIHRFKMASIDGGEIDFSQFKGKKILIVNVASECGYTSQYAKLQELSVKYADKLVVVGIPCNDFGGQEPGSNEKIAAFCQSRYGVTFPMTTKVKIKGEGQHPIYKWLTNKSENGVSDAKVTWNFNKFLIDEQGRWMEHFSSGVGPLDKKILEKL